MFKSLIYITFMWLLLSTSLQSQTVLAFPEAMGHGQNAGVNQPAKTVYFVTNLNNSGAGSLRDALSQSNRYIVFEVAGTITLSSIINVTASNLYIAGQTAFKNGGKGITIRANGNYNNALINFNGDHVIVRYIRFRRGPGLPNEVSGDNVNFVCNNWIIDHCSLSWTTDENINAHDGSFGTMQYCISSEGLYFSTHAYSTNTSHGTYQTGHSKGGLFGYSGHTFNNLTVYRNLFAHNDGRNPNISAPGSAHEVVNNLLYNNRYFNIELDNRGGSMQTNVVKNLLIPGSDTRTNRHMVHAVDQATNQVYMQGNIGVHRTTNSQPEWIEVGRYGTPNSTVGQSLTPFTTPIKDLYSSLPDASGLEPIVLADVGANLASDAVDQRIINDVINRTPTQIKTVPGTNPTAWNGASQYYGIINDPSEVGGWPSLAPMSSVCVDTDNDGMPNDWELLNNLDPNDPSDMLVDYGNGYPNIEVYLNSLAGTVAPPPPPPPTTPCAETSQDTIAFPGAMGYGRYAGVGQPVRTVYSVTNLNDSGPGSLRDALSQSNRFIVFKVAGTITLNSIIDVNAGNLYIAGQTAFQNGGEGITIRSSGSISQSLINFRQDHIIIRYIRFRRGPGVSGEVSGDNFNLFCSNWILDHCSISWGTDENLSSSDGSFGTVQYCISSECLYFSTHAVSTTPSASTYQTGHSKGSLFGYTNHPFNNITIYRNLFAHNDARSPKIASPGSAHEVVNNLMYNNRYFNIELDAKGGSMQSNVVKNLLIPGRDTRTARYMVHTTAEAANQIYMRGNIGVHRTNDSQPEWNEVGSFSNPIGNVGQVFSPFSTPMESDYSALPDAMGLESIVLADVGANLAIDAVDQRIINDVINRTPTNSKTVPGIDPNEWSGQATYYGIINNPSEVGGWPTISPMSSVPLDSDNDGIPNAWETANGLDSNNPNDALADHLSGYTNMEVYLSDLAGSPVSTGPVLSISLNICLEGPQTASAVMDNTLLQRDLLPTGQPYNATPWNYPGTEGDGWTSADYPTSSVDWVLISLRETISATSEVAKVAAVVLQDGSITTNICLPSNLKSEYYLVVEHRNHLPAMTPQPIDMVGNTLTYDFRAADSYAVGSGFGQKLVNGTWCLYSCNADQNNISGYEITGQDNILWQGLNGSFDIYEAVDFDMDGDVNAMDKLLWSINNGIFSAVPR